jgi:hypothetical protein
MLHVTNKFKSSFLLDSNTLTAAVCILYPGLLTNAISTEVSSQKVMKFRVLKVESANSTMSGSQSFRGSFMIPLPVTTLIM